jgi:hypothetical protein
MIWLLFSFGVCQGQRTGIRCASPQLSRRGHRQNRDRSWSGVPKGWIHNELAFIVFYLKSFLCVPCAFVRDCFLIPAREQNYWLFILLFFASIASLAPLREVSFFQVTHPAVLTIREGCFSSPEINLAKCFDITYVVSIVHVRYPVKPFEHEQRKGLPWLNSSPMLHRKPNSRTLP